MTVIGAAVTGPLVECCTSLPGRRCGPALVPLLFWQQPNYLAGGNRRVHLNYFGGLSFLSCDCSSSKKIR